MSYDVSTGFSGAASGAAAGATVGSVVPGIGTAIGAGVGGLAGAATGFFGGGGGGDDDEARQQAISQNRNLLGMLEDRFRTKQMQGPTDTTLFAAGMSQAREQAQRQAEADASQAAARGLTGSQYEVAQDANRQRQLGRTQRQLLARGDRVQREEERAALRSLLRQRGTLNNLIEGEAAAQRQGGLQRAQLAQGALRTVGQFALSGGGGGGG
jgi:hypothetical protein